MKARLKLFILILFYFSTTFLKLYSQTPASAGIVITDKSTGNIAPKHENVILELESANKNKGMLFPRMTVNQMKSIVNPKDGLMVFVLDTNPNISGLWYYDPYKKDWVRYLLAPQPYKSIEPEGSIIIWTGSLINFMGYDGVASDDITNCKGKGNTGTEFEGWAICNGLNGTPDLSKRFIVGGYFANEQAAVAGKVPELAVIKKINESLSETDKYNLNYENITLGQGTGGGIVHKVDEAHMPMHKHEKVTNPTGGNTNFEHTHEINSDWHFHEFEGTPHRGNQDGSTPLLVNKNSVGNYEMQTNILTFSNTNQTDDGDSDPTTPAIDSPKIRINLVKTEEVGTPTQSLQTIDHMPPYYKVIYLMRLSDTYTCPGN